DGDAPGTLTWRWFRNTSLLAGQTGSTLANSFFSKTDSIICEETPVDEYGFSGAANNSSALVISNYVPIIYHATSFVNSSGTLFNFSAGAYDGDGAGDIVRVNYSTNADACDQAGNVSAGNEFNVTYNCSAHGAVNVTVQFWDASNASVQTAQSTYNFTVDLPTTTAPNITPSPAYKTSTLTCNNGTFYDPDGELFGFNTWRWFLNGSLISGQTNDTLDGLYFNKTDSIICEQTPYDIAGQGGLANNSSVIVIQNSVPTIAVQTTYADASLGHWFYLNATGSDADGAGDIASIFANATAGSCAPHANSSAGDNFFASFNCSDAHDTGNFSIAFNDTSNASAASNAIEHTYPNHAPYLLAAPLISPNPAYSNDTLACADGTHADPDGDSITESYRWFVNGSLLAGQNGSTLGTAFYLKGYNVICEVTPTDQYGLAGASDNSSARTISNSAPTVAAGPAVTNGTNGHWFYLNATASDQDGGTDIQSVSASTSVGTCAAYSNSTSGINFTAVFNCSSAAAGTAELSVRFVDYSAASVTTGLINNSYPNQPPVASNVRIWPAVVYHFSDVSCTASATDPEGDPVTFAYQWYVNGTANGTGSPFDTAGLNASTLVCQATPNDGFSNGTAANSSSVTVHDGNWTEASLDPSNQTISDVVLTYTDPSDVRATLTIPAGTTITSPANYTQGLIFVTNFTAAGDLDSSNIYITLMGGPAGTTFSPAFTLSINYSNLSGADQATIESASSAGTLRIRKCDDSGLNCASLTPLSVDTAANIINVSISDFSTFGIYAPAAPAPAPSPAAVTNYGGFTGGAELPVPIPAPQPASAQPAPSAPSAPSAPLPPSAPSAPSRPWVPQMPFVPQRGAAPAGPSAPGASAPAPPAEGLPAALIAAAGVMAMAGLALAVAVGWVLVRKKRGLGGV
ncbi:MAG: hypothetical protein KGH63_02560, partial [Candidatus Micrarchaeota archaeon]|nr:hypothetical protein [Candidatus Micrarchaeota archaeon]